MKYLIAHKGVIFQAGVAGIIIKCLLISCNTLENAHITPRLISCKRKADPTLLYLLKPFLRYKQYLRQEKGYDDVVRLRIATTIRILTYYSSVILGKINFLIGIFANEMFGERTPIQYIRQV